MPNHLSKRYHQGCTGQPFFVLGAGQRNEFSGWDGAVQGLKSSRREGVTVKLGAFAGLGRAVLKIFGAGAAIFPGAGAGHASLVYTLSPPPNRQCPFERATENDKIMADNSEEKVSNIQISFCFRCTLPNSEAQNTKLLLCQSVRCASKSKDVLCLIFNTLLVY